LGGLCEFDLPGSPLLSTLISLVFTSFFLPVLYEFLESGLLLSGLVLRGHYSFLAESLFLIDKERFKFGHCVVRVLHFQFILRSLIPDSFCIEDIFIEGQELYIVFLTQDLWSENYFLNLGFGDELRKGSLMMIGVQRSDGKRVLRFKLELRCELLRNEVLFDRGWPSSLDFLVPIPLALNSLLVAGKFEFLSIRVQSIQGRGSLCLEARFKSHFLRFLLLHLNLLGRQLYFLLFERCLL
jgi:hypothetical protein